MCINALTLKKVGYKRYVTLGMTLCHQVFLWSIQGGYHFISHWRSRKTVKLQTSTMDQRQYLTSAEYLICTCSLNKVIGRLDSIFVWRV